MVQWNAWAIPGLSALLLGSVLAWLVLRLRPENPQARWLAVLMIGDSLFSGLATGGRALVHDADAAIMMYTVGAVMGLGVAFPAYFHLLATFRSPARRVLAGRSFRAALWSVSLIGVLAMAFTPAWRPGAHAFVPSVDAWAVAPPTILVLLVIGLFLSTIVLVFLSYHHARTPLARQRAAYYVAAFCTHNVTFLMVAVLSGFVVGRATHLGMVLVLLGFPAATFLMHGFLVYGFLKAHIFDVDLRLKRGLARSVLVAGVVGAVLLVGQLIQNATSQAFGIVGGAIVATILLLAIRPLDRAASRVADAVAPTVQPTSDYLAYRKMEVYRAAVEELAVGGFTEKDRRVLDALRSKLDIATADAEAMERDLVAELEAAPHRDPPARRM